MKSKYIFQFLFSLLVSLSFTLGKHYEWIPHSVRQPTFYHYSSVLEFVVAFLGVWGILGIGIVVTNLATNKTSTLICPHCEFVLDCLMERSFDQKCPKCGTGMVSIKGFYNKNNT